MPKLPGIVFNNSTKIPAVLVKSHPHLKRNGFEEEYQYGEYVQRRAAHYTIVFSSVSPMLQLKLESTTVNIQATNDHDVPYHQLPFRNIITSDLTTDWNNIDASP